MLYLSGLAQEAGEEGVGEGEEEVGEGERGVGEGGEDAVGDEDGREECELEWECEGTEVEWGNGRKRRNGMG